MRLVVFVVALALASCTAVAPTAAPDSFIDGAFVPPPKGSLVVLLPPNGSPAAAARGEELIQEHVHGQLVAAGYRVAGLERANYAVIWEQEIAAVGGIYDAKSGAFKPKANLQAMAQLARRVAASTGCSLVLEYQLVERPATLSGRSAQWDGQVRQQQVVGAYGNEYRHDGSTVGLSVRLFGLLADGRVAFKTYGGTSLPYQINARSAVQEFRPNLFISGEETAEGVKLALAPIVGRELKRVP